MPGNYVRAHQGCQVPFRPPIPNVGLFLRLSSGKELHLAMTGDPRGFSGVAAGIEFRFSKMKRVLGMDGGDGCTTV